MFIALAQEFKKIYGISVNKSPFTHDVNFTVLTVSELHSNTKTNYLQPFCGVTSCTQSPQQHIWHFWSISANDGSKTINPHIIQVPAAPTVDVFASKKWSLEEERSSKKIKSLVTL